MGNSANHNPGLLQKKLCGIMIRIFMVRIPFLLGCHSTYGVQALKQMQKPFIRSSGVSFTRGILFMLSEVWGIREHLLVFDVRQTRWLCVCRMPTRRTIGRRWLVHHRPYQISTWAVLQGIWHISWEDAVHHHLRLSITHRNRMVMLTYLQLNIF